MPRKPNADLELDELEIEEEEKASSPVPDAPFDPWGTEEEESDRRRDPLRSPV